MKPKILGFSKVWYSNLYPLLQSDQYVLEFVTINKIEKKIVEKLGGKVIGCLEEEYNNLPLTSIPDGYLKSSFTSDRFNHLLKFEDRIEYLSKVISFWEQIFSKGKYDFCLHETIAVEIDEVLSLTARKFNVLDFTHLTFLFPDTFFWKSNPYNSSITNRRLANAQISDDNINYAKEYLIQIENKGYKPSYVQGVHKVKRIKLSNYRLAYQFLKNSIKEHLGFKKKLDYSYVKWDILFNQGNNVFNPYNSLDHIFYDHWINILCQNNYDYNQLDDLKDIRFIFYPLHYEPEATLAYFENQIVNQENIIQEICKNLPSNVALVVKEHPQQQGKLLTKRYVDLRAHNSNLFYLQGAEDSNQIIKMAKAVIVMVGSVGWESVLQKIPTLCFGNVHFNKHPDIINIQNYTLLKNINQIIKSKKFVEREKSIDFIARLHTFACVGDPVLESPQKKASFLKASLEKEINLYKLCNTEYWLKKDLDIFYKKSVVSD